ncbi:MAG: site-specific DNA-methyltransferase [bacterium]
MPTLNWIGKEKIVNHDKDVAFRLLKKNKTYSLGESENLILEGDNLEALKALMPFYYNKIKCIYIDPPYNTGNEKWVYNDRVNSPKIAEWFRKTVGPEGEDLCRHDKWLCMMYPRLKLLRELLSDDGVIFISINDNEVHHLRLLMGDIFGEDNFVAKIVWENKEGGGSSDSKYFKIKHEYILTYARNKELLLIKGIEVEDEDRYSLKDKWVSVRGKYQLVKLNSASIQYGKSLDYPIKSPENTFIYPSYGEKRACWRWSKKKLVWGLKNDFVVIKKDKNGKWAVYTKQYFNVDNDGNITERTNRPFGVINKFSSTMAAKDLENIFGKKIFNYSKPYLLVRYLIELTCRKDSIILDSFAGSGTTGHAVLDLNREDGGNRKFILVELEKNIAKNITAERIKRVVKGYSYKKSSGETVKVAGLGGGFEFVELGEPLFDKDGAINKTVSFDDMARYVYFTETRTNLEKKNIKGNYLGEFGSSHYFLLFNGIGKNILDRKFLQEIKKTVGKKVVYADKCLLDDEVLEKHQIVFKQIPYQVKVY